MVILPMNNIAPTNETNDYFTGLWIVKENDVFTLNSIAFYSQKDVFPKRYYNIVLDDFYQKEITLEKITRSESRK